MAQMTPQVSEVLEKALSLSEQERELLIDRLAESLANESLKVELSQLGTKRSSAG